MNRINLIRQAALKVQSSNCLPSGNCVQSGKVLAKPLNYEKLCNNVLQLESVRVKLSASEFKTLDFN